MFKTWKLPESFRNFGLGNFTPEHFPNVVLLLKRQSVIEFWLRHCDLFTVWFSRILYSHVLYFWSSTVSSFKRCFITCNLLVSRGVQLREREGDFPVSQPKTASDSTKICISLQPYMPMPRVTSCDFFCLYFANIAHRQEISAVAGMWPTTERLALSRRCQNELLNEFLWCVPWFRSL